MPSARVTLDLASEAEAGVVHAALSPELGGEVPGSRALLVREGPRLELALEAEDAGALRAALNSYLRWAQLALDVHHMAGRGPPGP